MKPNSKHMDWAAIQEVIKAAITLEKMLQNYLSEMDYEMGGFDAPCATIAVLGEKALSHLAAFEAEVREDMAETHVDKADAWDATIRAGKRLIDLNGWRIDMENMPETIKFVARRSDGKIETACRYNNPFGSERPTVINTATGKWFEPIAWYPLPPDDSREITLPAQPEKEGE